MIYKNFEKDILYGYSPLHEVNVEYMQELENLKNQMEVLLAEENK